MYVLIGGYESETLIIGREKMEEEEKISMTFFKTP